MFLFGLGFFKLKMRPESLDIPVLCILLPSGYGLFHVTITFNRLITTPFSLSSLSALDSMLPLCIMIIAYFFALVLSGKGYSWIVEGAKPEPRKKEKYWW